MTELAYDFDLFVIGGGSGGVRAARMAASYGARVAIVAADLLAHVAQARGPLLLALEQLVDPLDVGLVAVPGERAAAGKQACALALADPARQRGGLGR